MALLAITKKGSGPLTRTSSPSSDRGKSPTAAELSLKQMRDQIQSTMLAEERKRLEMIQRRQEREIAQMMAYEQKMADVAAENAEKEAAKKAKFEEMQRERMEKRREMLQKKVRDAAQPRRGPVRTS
jgi:hypothetical protein